MAGLGETTARLKRSRRGAPYAAPTRMAVVEDFGANPGALRMLVHRPKGLPVAAPLVLVLHGCTQRAEAFAIQAGWLTLAERQGFVVVAAEQGPANNPNRCFNWFEPQHTRRDAGEAASLAQMVGHAVREYGVDPGRVFVTGLSAGGAMAAVMLAAYPELFAGGAVVAGLPYGAARDVGGALRVMRTGSGLSAEALGVLIAAEGRPPPVAIWHGEADHVVSPRNAVELAQQWAAGSGLSAEGDAPEAMGRRTRTRWRDPHSGEVTVELNLVKGLGHGVPLAAGGVDGLGTAAPYMLEAGISSTLEVAGFFGLVESCAKPAPRLSESAMAEESPHESLGAQVMASISPYAPAGVQDVVARALRTAGLNP